MSEPTLYGLCELARELGLPESTTRYYRDVFATHVPSVGFGRKRRYPEETLSVLRFIAEAFSTGRTREEIERALSDGAAPDPQDTAAVPQPFSLPQRPADLESRTHTGVSADREQRELMWQMIHELSRFGDAIERQHNILTEIVEHVFRGADRRLPAANDGDELESVVDAEIVTELAEPETRPHLDDSLPAGREDVEELRKALEAERDLVSRLRQSKLDLERRAAAAEAKLEQTHEQAPSLLRRLLERDRDR